MKNKLKLYDFSRLKSNMDRFIVVFLMLLLPAMSCLKSNMDRFIDRVKGATAPLWVSLKSNMDRFIVDFKRSFRV